MNKYKEALETLKYEVFEEGHCSYIENEISVAIEALEKAVPKKVGEKTIVFQDEDFYEYDAECPICGYAMQITTDFVDELQYCPRCGQALDWSEG